jgi:hypothetical protein
MRLALLFATLLAACAVNANAAPAGPVILSCPEAGDALAARLCAALRRELEHPKAAVADGETLHLTLQASSPRPEMLRARLGVGLGAARREGPELELSVVDRVSIPDSQLRQLARLLLDQTFPSGK